MKFTFLFFLVLLFAAHSCTDKDDNLSMARPQDVIMKDSEMFTLLERMTTETDDPMEDIVCIDFVYPLEVKLYNNELIETSSVILTDDAHFSAFLGMISPSQALSISYPIETTLSDGSLFSVTNNTELKIAIDNCSQEDIIGYCNGIFTSEGGSGEPVDCVWEVAYEEGRDNTYAGGTFLINPDNSLIFNYNGTDYPGNWIFLFVDNQLHLNINLEGTSEAATYWNVDRRAVLLNSRILIANNPDHIALERACQETGEFSIGDTGPAGGLVFYDKGEYTNGWRYMEAAPEDLGFFEWGCSGTSISGTHAGMGYGMVNSVFIANLHDTLDDFYNNPSVCNAANNGTVAAQKALLFEVNGYSDWLLPSHVELALMYSNLHLQGLGGFTPAPYWSSTEMDADNAQTVDFTDGSGTATAKIPAVNTVHARAIRYF